MNVKAYEFYRIVMFFILLIMTTILFVGLLRFVASLNLVDTRLPPLTTTWPTPYPLVLLEMQKYMETVTICNDVQYFHLHRRVYNKICLNNSFSLVFGPQLPRLRGKPLSPNS